MKSTVIEWLILCRQSFQNIGYAEIKISIILVNLQINLKIFLLLNKKYIRSTVLFFFLETPFLLKARINLSFSSSFSRFVFSFHSFFFFGWLKNKAILYPLYVDVTQLVGLATNSTFYCLRINKNAIRLVNEKYQNWLVHLSHKVDYFYLLDKQKGGALLQ